MKILILGIGNILFGDEGVGAHLAHYLDEKYDFYSEHQIDIIDGGTLAHALIPLIVEYDEVLLIDCIEAMNSNAGDVFYFPFSRVPKEISWQGSAHEVETLQTLQMMHAHGDIPNIKILGIVPKRLKSDSSFKLSQSILQAATLLEKAVFKFLHELDSKIQISIHNEINLNQISAISYKRAMRQQGD